MVTGNKIAKRLAEVVDRDMTFMHVCGTHEASISRHGIRSLLPSRLKIVMGPGCPVCITPQGEIDAAIELLEKGCIIATYGDLLRVPGSSCSLGEANGDVRVVQGVHKAVEIAQKEKEEVVFVSCGFETTAPTVAATLMTNPPDNFSILSCHRLIPPAMEWLLDQGEAALDGFLLPGHVLVISGITPYERFPVPQAVAGFEADDILLGLFMLAEQVVHGECRVDNAYPRAVLPNGNQKAQDIMDLVFEPVDASWRGFPVIKKSGLALREPYAKYDAWKKFGVVCHETKKHSACVCDRVLRGIAQPDDCRLYGTACTPKHPVGPCMVSHEGACRIWHQYHRQKAL